MKAPTAETTLEEARATLTTLVYHAALYLEQLERVGLVTGNGHHLAQRIAGYADGVLESRWHGKEQS